MCNSGEERIVDKGLGGAGGSDRYSQTPLVSVSGFLFFLKFFSGGVLAARFGSCCFFSGFRKLKSEFPTLRWVATWGRKKKSMQQFLFCNNRLSGLAGRKFGSMAQTGDSGSSVSRDRSTQQREGQLRRCRTAEAESGVGPRWGSTKANEILQRISELNDCREKHWGRAKRNEGEGGDGEHRRRMELTSGAVVAPTVMLTSRTRRGTTRRGKNTKGE